MERVYFSISSGNEIEKLKKFLGWYADLDEHEINELLLPENKAIFWESDELYRNQDHHEVVEWIIEEHEFLLKEGIKFDVVYSRLSRTELEALTKEEYKKIEIVGRFGKH